ncbi:MmgE/PrpD family protein [Dehalococcoidia bacterium]|nr:MmgE/PrpD family protein [Dehalococcoidia bacterium]
MASETVSQILSKYILGLRYEDFPQEVVAKAKQCILDQLGVQLRGGTLEWVQPEYEMARRMESKPDSTIAYHGTKMAPAYAAFVNGTFGQSSETDDIGPGGHVGAAAVPASMAIGEMARVDGKTFIKGVVAGYEVMARTGRALSGRLGDRGFHLQGVNGVFGSVASAGVLLGLNEKQMVNAFGIAGSHSSGITEYTQVGGEVKRAHAGIANFGGVHSALLAHYGLTGPVTVFEGKKGVFHAFADVDDGIDSVIGDLGEEWVIMLTGFKPYPTVITLHSPLDALNKALAGNDLNHKDIKEIRVGMAAHGVTHGASIYRPKDVVGAQFSLAFSFGLRIVRGKNDLSDYMNPAMWEDQAILDIADKVQPYGHPGATGVGRFAQVEVELKNGGIIEATVSNSKGSADNPMTSEEFEAKFRMLAAPAISEHRQNEILMAVNNLENLPKVSELIDLLKKD